MEGAMAFVVCKSPMERTAHPDRMRSMAESRCRGGKEESNQFRALRVSVWRIGDSLLAESEGV